MKLQSSLLGEVASPPRKRLPESPRAGIRRIARGCGAGAAVVGLAVLAAWGVGVGDLTALVPGLPTMVPNTALSIVLGGASLILWTTPRTTRASVASATGSAMGVCLLAASALSAHLLGTPGIPFRQLPAPQTAVSLALLGGALIGVGRRPAPWLALGSGSIAILAGLGHLFGLGLLYSGPHPIGVSLSTVAALLVLSLGVLLVRPEQGFMATVTADDAGGWVARRLLLVLVAVAPAAALLLLGVRQGWYDLSAATAAIVFLGCASGTVSIVVASARLNRLAEQRRRSEERARELQDQASDGIFVADLDGRYIEVNAAGCRMLGYSREEILERTILEIIPPEEAPRLARAREALLQGGIQVDEWMLRRKDGSSLPVEVSAKILPDGRWQAFVRDISERRRAETALRRFGERERFRMALEAAAGAVVVVERDGRIAFINAEAERFFGWSREELTGRAVETLVPERFRARHGRHRDSFFAGEVSKRPMGEGRELFAVRKDGGELPVEISLTRFEEGGQEFVVASVADIRLRKAAEGALRESEKRLRRSVLELESFAYTVSHDLRAPLRAIEGYSHLLVERLADRGDPEINRMLDRMAKSAERLDRLIRDLLHYTAISREEARLEAVELDLLIDDVIGHHPEFARARLRIRSPLGRVQAQPLLLLQALSNLLDNAVRHVPGDRTPEIEIWTERKGAGRLLLTIQDNGVGIPPESWESVFKPFVRLHPTDDEGSTGIGLAIVKRAVEQMGGSVSLDSEPGRGSRFRIELQEA